MNVELDLIDDKHELSSADFNIKLLSANFSAGKCEKHIL